MSTLKRWFESRIPWDESPASLNHHRIYILPNRYGLLFALLLIALLIGATNYGASLGYLLTFLLAGIGLSSMLHSFRNLLGLELRIGPAAAVFAGDASRFPLELYNPSTYHRFMLTIRCGEVELPAVDLAPQQQLRIELPLTASQRGYQTPGRISLTTAYPLGLYRCWALLGSRQRGIVYPKPLRDSLPLPEQPSEAELQRETVLGWEEFHGTRTYRAGDSPRQIAWRAIAKGQGILSKEYRDPQAEQLRLDWDRLSGDPEQRLSQLTAWVLAAEQRGLDYQLHLPGELTNSGSGERHKHHCLQRLALFGLEQP